MKEELEKEMKPCLEKKNFFLKRERERSSQHFDSHIT